MLALIAVLVHISVVFAATADQWRGRSIYQVLTDRFALTNGTTTKLCDTSQRVYCGGAWQGLINKLDYIQGMGFSAVWISPVTHQTPISNASASGESFHGYWQDDLYSLNPAFGSPDDLRALSAALHKRNMFLMVDIVVNHFSWPGDPSTINYTAYRPFNQAEHFHPFCQIQDSDYSNNQTRVEQCWLGNDINQLPDVNTESDFVQSTYKSWIKSLIANYSIDGLRIDTVRHIRHTFWSSFVSAAGVYAVGEIFDGDPLYTCPYQTALGASTAGVLNYPAYFSITQAFSSTNGSISALANQFNTIKSTCPDTNLLGSFLENHDNPRFPTLTQDSALTQNAIAFALLQDGIPIVYQGQEQHYSGGADPANREALWLSGYNTSSALYTFIRQINTLRNTAVARDKGYTTYKAWPIHTDNSTIALRKGSDGKAMISVFSNLGVKGQPYTLNISQTGYYPGSVVVEILSCHKYTVSQNGTLAVDMGAGALGVFYPLIQLSGSGICGAGKRPEEGWGRQWS
ncbi:MAG: hypothetical protein GOMPHAMPRED_007867 [Gomphillus americanus]|uniref:alpha-amylase n=1 Tax=Gomphillus americanus TaxID=1940652 RepID=A0A8H3EVB4_9LECA|nr:MAG: hypothetical protein GOMPHAMPRED_007867 [Gomphillus americanus]